VAAADPEAMSEITEVTVSVTVDERLAEVVDRLAAVTQESRSEMCARLIAAGVAHKGFMIPKGVPC
jgi:predicted transcriptional regulator